jgi:alcohol dehydrogenase (cytochrome c)
MYFANRNGFFYVLDRATGQFLSGKPYVEVTWAKGLDEKGRPIRIPGKEPSAPPGTLISPGNQGGPIGIRLRTARVRVCSTSLLG